MPGSSGYLNDRNGKTSENWRRKAKESKAAATREAKARIVQPPNERKGKTSENWRRKATGLKSKRKKISEKKSNPNQESPRRYWID
jgi:hypothetical protein